MGCGVRQAALLLCALLLLHAVVEHTYGLTHPLTHLIITAGRDRADIRR